MALLKRLFERLRRPSRRFGVGVLAGGGVLAGVLLVSGFNTFTGYTNSTEFCVSCHTMDWNMEEWKQSHHYSNTRGIRAECADCHVPREFFPKIGAKIKASNDVWHELRGTISTRDKFDERREYLAERVWERMERTDSRECRHCHDYDSMALDDQPTRARRQHEDAVKAGETCIECHKGVAHEYPKTDETEEPDFSF